MIGEVEVHGRGLLAVEGGDEGVYAEEDAFGGLDADDHCVAGEGAGGEDCGVGGGFEVDFDFGQGLVEGWNVSCKDREKKDDDRCMIIYLSRL